MYERMQDKNMAIGRSHTMNKWMIIVGIVVLAYTATGQTAPKSDALQIARAAGLKQLSDVPQEKLEQAIKSHRDLTTSNVITTVGVGTKMFEQQTGWSLGSETAALGVLTVLSALPVHQPEMHTRLLVWMPVDQAATREDAAILLKSLVVHAYRKALPNMTIRMANKQTKGFPNNPMTYLKVQSGQCPDCGVYMPAVFHYEARPKKRKAPEILGGYDAYRWSVDGFRNASLAGYPMFAENLTPDERMNILTAVSLNLPTWIYVYVAPHENLAGFPLLLNAGNPMFFIEPDK
ncbi:MAG: hypothetical protein ACR2PS_08325 [Pseudomonadales bacterium]